MPGGILLPQESHILGERIATRRKEKGLTQLRLAESLDVERCMISYYETAKVPITVEKLLLVCRVLDTPISYFLEGLDHTH